MSCSCLVDNWQERPSFDRFERRELPGLDERDGLFADVAIERCLVCSSHWINYHFEFEAFSKSGRWYLGLIPADTADEVTVHNAREILEGLEWYWAGGSYFDGDVHRRSGALST